MERLIRLNLKSLTGLLAIIFGLVALFLPGITITALGIYFAITILIGGTLQFVSAFQLRKQTSRWYLALLEGLIGIIIAAIILSRPQILAPAFVAIMGLWSFFLGLFFLYIYFKKRLSAFFNSSVLIISIISLVTGFIILINPFESTKIIMVIIGIYALAYGIFSLLSSSRHYM